MTIINIVSCFLIKKSDENFVLHNGGKGYEVSCWKKLIYPSIFKNKLFRLLVIPESNSKRSIHRIDGGEIEQA